MTWNGLGILSRVTMIWICREEFAMHSMTPSYRRLLRPTLILCAMIVPLPCFADSAGKRIGALLAEYTQNRQFNGVALVARSSGTVLYRAYGSKNVVQEPLSATAKMPIASLTKAFTAAAILKLHERRKLSLEDGVHTLLETRFHD